ncbi:L,D-transpeptidase family protein [Teredinibacter purpureus]|uniref:L,D-transpeptidase family protein n=1 Tax=Teredinibacter purpureus TaxID=2731756 RepID=UPI0005F786F3|nr:murein L,D-transpeptidase family protein [Teredinibacter purpureus]
MVKIAFILFFWVPLYSVVAFAEIPESDRSRQVFEGVSPSLREQLQSKNLALETPLFIRIFKQPGVLEVWKENALGKFELFKRYNTCYFSGALGPKTRQGDLQSPEGFYFVPPASLNPWSRYHLSFNLGYPNAYDRSHGRTGSALMVHGRCVSIGCYAMTNAYINEIYTLLAAALRGGQPFVRVHIFPFHLTDEKLKPYQHHQWYEFWKNLKEGYDFFESHKVPPNVTVEASRYVFD